VERQSIFSGKEIAFLRELTSQRVPFMIVGLSGAALQGAPMVTQDVDLWFRDIRHPGLKRALRKVGGCLVPSDGRNPPAFAGDSVRCFDIVLTVHGIGDFDEEEQNAVSIPLGNFSVKVLPIERIIASKRYLNREKDRMALPALKAAAAALRAAEGVRHQGHHAVHALHRSCACNERAQPASGRRKRSLPRERNGE